MSFPITKLDKDEYSSFYFKEADKNLNGDLTAGENTADNGGVWESMYGLNYSRAREADKPRYRFLIKKDVDPRITNLSGTEKPRKP